jgi:flavin-dependent dehydrogenase
MYYDAIVLGAGPGGCMAARTLSDAGFKAVLVEREKLPREKPCGGFVSPQAAGLIEEAFGPIPSACLSSPHAVRGARLLVEGGGEYEMPFPGTGLSAVRSRLDAHLAAGCGAEVMDGCEVSGIHVQSFHVTVRLVEDGRERTLESTYLVAADGADSMALRILRPEFYRLYAVPRLERTMLVMSEGGLEWDPEWLGLALLHDGMGIARFFVKGGLVGLAVNHDAGKGWQEELDRLVEFLLQSSGLRLRGEAMRRLSASNRMAARGRYSLGTGCALLAGEAAGLLDPWGFGIRLALESGRVAAESVVESSGERITPYVRYLYRMQDILEREIKQRRGFGGLVGDLDTASLAGDKSRAARRDRRALKKRFSR